MEKENKAMRVHPTPISHNNTKRESYYGRNSRNPYLQYGDDIYYKDVLLERLAQEIMRFEMYKAKINELEKRLEELEKSKIVTAPVKVDKPIRKVEIVDVKALKSNNIRNQRAIQTYSTNAKIKVETEKPTLPIAVKEEKISWWQKIKNAVKSFFAEEEKPVSIKPEPQTWSQQNNSSSNMKSTQFRQSIPKTTIKIDVNKNTNTTIKKEQNHIFDRYA